MCRRQMLVVCMLLSIFVLAIGATLRTGADTAASNDEAQEHRRQSITNVRKPAALVQHPHKRAPLKEFKESALSRTLAKNPGGKRVDATMEALGRIAKTMKSRSTEGEFKEEEGGLKKLHTADANAITIAVVNNDDASSSSNDDNDDGFQYSAAEGVNWLLTEYRSRTDCTGPIAITQAECYMCLNVPINFNSDGIDDDNDYFYSSYSYQSIDDQYVLSSRVIVADGISDDADTEAESSIDAKRLFFSGKNCKFSQLESRGETVNNQRCEWGVQKRVQKNKLYPYIEKPGVLEMHFWNPNMCYRFLQFYFLSSISGGGGGGEITPRFKLEGQQQQQQQQQQQLQASEHQQMQRLLSKHPHAERFKSSAAGRSISTEDVRLVAGVNGPAATYLTHYNVCVYDGTEKRYHKLNCDASTNICTERYYRFAGCKESGFISQDQYSILDELTLCGYEQLAGTLSSSIPVNSAVLRLLVDNSGPVADSLLNDDDISIVI